ncbi:MAG: serine/threonine-protein phosphatase [Microthrixaceae bacterium]|nr:serine/threonine-protein phosphatase [Microthrixaceae bacterium]HPB45721.1 PP2C family protein-serine/threonine phosphatase [Microthrixaceae bacterium]
MLAHWFLFLIAVLAVVGATAWFRSAFLRYRVVRNMTTNDPGVRTLSQTTVLHQVHTGVVYVVIAGAALASLFTDDVRAWYLIGAISVPALFSLWAAQFSKRDARLSEERVRVEQRALEMLAQNDSAPQRWAERLAPAELIDTPGYDIAVVHEAVAGVMSGDLVDVFRLPSGRVGCVVGDVSGHDVEASITALQTKFLLRSYLRRYRDPGQALEELNRQVSDYERPEEFVSLFVMIFDEEAEVMRYASAGHPAAWMLHDRELSALPATGPILMMNPEATFQSREIPIVKGDLVVCTSDGIAEARDGSNFFGEDRVAGMIRKMESATAEQASRSLVNAAQEFVAGPLQDDVTVLAVRRAD